MSETNVIKSIEAHTCPHCGKEVFIESNMTPPVIKNLFTAEEANKAKKDCIERVETLTIDDEKKAVVIKWLSDPETIFAPTEVESIILSLLQPN